MKHFFLTLLFILLFPVCVMAAPGITCSLGKSTDGWAGAIPVYITLTDLSNTNYPYARARVVTAGSATFYTSMSWSEANARFEGVIYPGSNYCNGCADPTTGTFTVTGQLDNDAAFGSIDYSASDVTFATIITRRYPSSSSSIPTAFIPTYNTDHWEYEIVDLSVNAASTQSNIAVAIPFHPTTASISNIAVTIDDVAVSGGSAASTSNAWWWDTDSHTLYVQWASLGTTYSHVGITFNSDTDLFATRVDRYLTEHFSERLFYNGLTFSNAYITTTMFGGGYENAGEQVDMQGTSSGLEIGIDCMERVAIHVDDTTNSDASGYYNYNIKWKQTEWASYITAENNNYFTISNNSDDTASTGWKPQLDNGVSVSRTINFYADKRYVKNYYQITNGDDSAHKYSFIWGREQWIDSADGYNSKQVNDRGRFAGDLSDRVIETSLDPSTLSNAWMVAYDTSSYGAMGVIFQSSALPSLCYFLVQAPITTSTAEWPVTVTNQSTTTNSQTFFSKDWSSVAPSATVDLTFWQFGGAYFTSWEDINSAISADYNEVNNIAAVVSHTKNGIIKGGYIK